MKIPTEKGKTIWVLCSSFWSKIPMLFFRHFIWSLHYLCAQIKKNPLKPDIIHTFWGTRNEMCAPISAFCQQLYDSFTDHMTQWSVTIEEKKTLQTFANRTSFGFFEKKNGYILFLIITFYLTNLFVPFLNKYYLIFQCQRRSFSSSCIFQTFFFL